MSRLVIAEKPSVARDLSRVLQAKQKNKGFYQGNGWLVTWCIGHLVELCEPHEYNAQWKRWALPTLPMIPESFRLRPSKRTTSQYNIVSRLLTRRDVTSVVNACDAGREGELIFRYVYELSNSNKPIERLWISSMTDEAIRDGFANLRPGTQYQALWDAARCRSEADWLVGLNATRAMTVRSRQLTRQRDAPLYSIGRVQTPTLAMLVRRELEIRAFEPEDYWQIRAHFHTPEGDYQGRWFKKKNDRFKAEKAAQDLIDSLTGHPGIVDKVEKKIAKERPPLLFDLTRLQRTANKRYGYSAARTLELAQKLYESHKLITYPRTDSAHLPSDQRPKIAGILRALDSTDPYAPFALHLLNATKIPMPRRIFNDSKVSDHHAIIPTSKTPQLGRLSPEERNIYDLIVRRFIGAFYPDAVFEKTKVITKILEETFVSRGKIVVDPGWRTVAGWNERPGQQARSSKKQGQEDDDNAILPPLEQGQTNDVKDLELQKKKTKPPPRYTEATLLAAMEGAGKLLEEEEYQQAMKDSGLGTPATRASIIETLLSRDYVTRQGKTLYPQERGIQLICAIPVESLSSPQLTGEWEAKLAQMARGEYSAARFQEEVRTFVQDAITRIKNDALESLTNPPPPRDDNQGPPPDGDDSGGVVRAGSSSRRAGSSKTNNRDLATIGTCPQCKGSILSFDKVFACRGPQGQERGCGFRIFREVAKKKLSDHMAKSLLTEGRTKLLKGFRSRAGNDFSAILILQDNGDVKFSFDENDAAAQTKGRKKSSAKNKQEATSTNTSKKAAKADKSDKKTSSRRKAAQESPTTKRKTKQHKSKDASQTNTKAQRGASASAPNSYPAQDSLALAPQTPNAQTRSTELNAKNTYISAEEFRKRQSPQTQWKMPAEDIPPPEHPMDAGAAPQSHHPSAPITPVEPAPATLEDLGKCPRCKRGQIIRGRRAWGCNRWREGCHLVIPYVFQHRPIQEDEAQQLLQHKVLGPLDGFLDQQQKPIRGNLFLDEGLDASHLTFQQTNDS